VSETLIPAARAATRAAEASSEVGHSGADLPTGNVTFLLTDIVGSTRLWEAAPGAMAVALARHDRLVHDTVTGHGGTLLKGRGEGDSTFSVFHRATDAAAAALAAQDALTREAWPAEAPIGVRMAIHTGRTLERGGDYYGREVNRTARLRGVAQRAQILVTAAVAEAIRPELPLGRRARDARHLDAARRRRAGARLPAPAPGGRRVGGPGGAVGGEGATVPLPARLSALRADWFVRAIRGDRAAVAAGDRRRGRGPADRVRGR